MMMHIYRIKYENATNAMPMTTQVIAHDWDNLFRYISKHPEEFGEIREIKLIACGVFEQAF